jgi:hypothetical protein
MLENFLTDPATIDRRRAGLFGPHLDSFLATALRKRYEDYLRKERGLSAATVAAYWYIVRRFIVERARTDLSSPANPGRHLRLPTAERSFRCSRISQADGDGTPLLLPVSIPARRDQDRFGRGRSVRGYMATR